MATPKPKVTPKAKPLTGAAAAEEYRKQVSKAGVKKAEANAKKAIDKKYPGLIKKSSNPLPKLTARGTR
jgi:hypothetical protein